MKWNRLATVLLVALGGAALAPAQPVGTHKAAAPPDKAVLDWLHLKAEWSVYLPIDGNRDSLEQVQTLDDQVFVQTRNGLLVAIDAITGRIQWSARLGNGSPGNAYPVAANSRFVFVASVTKLYAFYRYTGAAEFVTDLGTPPTTGLAADENAVYCVLGVRTGSAGAHRVAVYDMPRPITVDGVARAAGAVTVKSPGPVDELLDRYSPGTRTDSLRELPELSVRPKVLQAPIGGFSGSRSPSIATLPSVVPPYGLDYRSRAPSLNLLPSLTPPYRLRLEAGRYVQQTPSLSTIPPSIAASLLLSDLRPKPIAPPLRWEYGLSSRILYPLQLTPTRVWALAVGDTGGSLAVAFNKSRERGEVTIEAQEILKSPAAAPPAAAGLTHYIPLGNGTLISVDATSGNVAGGLTVKWRAAVGGINNHTPFVTKKLVYASGNDSGVACVDRESGDVVWQSTNAVDRIVAANEEFVYLRDHRGRLLIYDAKRATLAGRKLSNPLGSADMDGFDVPVVNTASDRVYLAADTGLIVCLRDAAPKYLKPMQVAEPPTVNSTQKIGVDTKPGTNPTPKKEGYP